MQESIQTQQDERLGESDAGLERLVFFNDAVFAIAITLLIIDIKVPDIGVSGLSDSVVAARLAQSLQDLAPWFRGYVIGFLVIAVYWMAHHRLFRYIRRYDGGLIWLNIFFLLCVAFLPFPTSLISRYGDLQIAVIFYAASTAVTGLVLFALWFHASRDMRLLDGSVDPRMVGSINIRLLITPAIFLLSIGISFLNVYAAEGSWIIIWLGRFLRRTAIAGVEQDR